MPWCMSQSTMSTRLQPRALLAWRAAMAIVLKRQKPIASCISAWCPGGRTTAIPLRTVPLTTLSVSSSTDPAAHRAASREALLR